MLRRMGGNFASERSRDPGETWIVSKATFRCLTFSLTILFAVAANVAVICLSSASGVRFQPRWMGGLTVIYVVLSHLAADNLLKLFGPSRSDKVVEVRSRSPFGADDDARIGEIAEARLSGGMFTFLPIGSPTMGVFLLASPLIMRRRGVMRWRSSYRAAILTNRGRSRPTQLGASWHDSTGHEGEVGHETNHELCRNLPFR